MAQDEEEMMKTPGFGWRVSLSIIVGIGWLVFLILWFFFYASDYTGYQNIAIFFLSLVIIGLILGVPWAYWGMRYRTEREKTMWETKGFKWRVALSTFLAFVLAAFLVYWFWYQAEDFGCIKISLCLSYRY
jgi:hypothetical protein